MKALITILSIVSIVLTVSSCGEEETLLLNNYAPDDQLPPTNEELVIANCYAVRDAAEAWAAENGGTYPSNTSDRTPLGNTLIDLLPNGERLTNPFTGAPTEPLDGVACTPGQTSYFPVMGGDTYVGYLIAGFGESDTIIEIVKEN